MVALLEPSSSALRLVARPHSKVIVTLLLLLVTQVLSATGTSAAALPRRAVTPRLLASAAGPALPTPALLGVPARLLDKRAPAAILILRHPATLPGVELGDATGSSTPQPDGSSPALGRSAGEAAVTEDAKPGAAAIADRFPGAAAVKPVGWHFTAPLSVVLSAADEADPGGSGCSRQLQEALEAALAARAAALLTAASSGLARGLPAAAAAVTVRCRAALAAGESTRRSVAAEEASAGAGACGARLLELAPSGTPRSMQVDAVLLVEVQLGLEADASGGAHAGSRSRSRSGSLRDLYHKDLLAWQALTWQAAALGGGGRGDVSGGGGDGGGGSGVWRVCAPALAEVDVATDVLVTYELPLSAAGVDVFSAACAAGTPAPGLGRGVGVTCSLAPARQGKQAHSDHGAAAAHSLSGAFGSGAVAEAALAIAGGTTQPAVSPAATAAASVMAPSQRPTAAGMAASAAVGGSVAAALMAAAAAMLMAWWRRRRRTSSQHLEPAAVMVTGPGGNKGLIAPELRLAEPTPLITVDSSPAGSSPGGGSGGGGSPGSGPPSAVLSRMRAAAAAGLRRTTSEPGRLLSLLASRVSSPGRGRASGGGGGGGGGGSANPSGGGSTGGVVAGGDEAAGSDGGAGGSGGGVRIGLGTGERITACSSLPIVTVNSNGGVVLIGGGGSGGGGGGGSGPPSLRDLDGGPRSAAAVFPQPLYNRSPLSGHASGKRAAWALRADDTPAAALAAALGSSGGGSVSAGPRGPVWLSATGPYVSSPTVAGGGAAPAGLHSPARASPSRCSPARASPGLSSSPNIRSPVTSFVVTAPPAPLGVATLTSRASGGVASPTSPSLASPRMLSPLGSPGGAKLGSRPVWSTLGGPAGGMGVTLGVGSVSGVGSVGGGGGGGSMASGGGGGGGVIADVSTAVLAAALLPSTVPDGGGGGQTSSEVVQISRLLRLGEDPDLDGEADIVDSDLVRKVKPRPPTPPKARRPRTPGMMSKQSSFAAAAAEMPPVTSSISGGGSGGGTEAGADGDADVLSGLPGEPSGVRRAVSYGGIGGGAGRVPGDGAGGDAGGGADDDDRMAAAAAAYPVRHTVDGTLTTSRFLPLVTVPTAQPNSPAQTSSVPGSARGPGAMRSGAGSAGGRIMGGIRSGVGGSTGGGSYSLSGAGGSASGSGGSRTRPGREVATRLADIVWGMYPRNERLPVRRGQGGVIASPRGSRISMESNPHLDVRRDSSSGSGAGSGTWGGGAGAGAVRQDPIVAHGAPMARRPAIKSSPAIAAAAAARAAAAAAASAAPAGPERRREGVIADVRRGLDSSGNPILEYYVRWTSPSATGGGALQGAVGLGTDSNAASADAAVRLAPLLPPSIAAAVASLPAAGSSSAPLPLGSADQERPWGHSIADSAASPAASSTGPLPPIAPAVTQLGEWLPIERLPSRAALRSFVGSSLAWRLFRGSREYREMEEKHPARLPRVVTFEAPEEEEDDE
ncbi:hypothetical protein HYH03_014378 [Edaphochlamys debaryana]|uniref:Uncharacterized protein n=1 Tax=Edaphochlamys debaryana TaxID=47281 RepID=A0A835XN85_9CHLO|nr:hypothetical protein HYH03_014378 [Edaphochlamys debaryana]|eukprot:KAG2487006.1 hypothetical protein HYH03_014378 [Edaphochlamys debaryana]